MLGRNVTHKVIPKTYKVIPKISDASSKPYDRQKAGTEVVKLFLIEQSCLLTVPAEARA